MIEAMEYRSLNTFFLFCFLSKISYGYILHFDDTNNSTEKLTIENNLIRKIEIGQFANFANLKKLRINKCSLEYIDESAFSDTHLEELDLSYNEIEDFPNLVPINNTLTTLDLSNNLLSSIACDLLQALTNLHKLNLTSNRLSTIPGSCDPSQILTIEELYLDYNPLYYVDQNSLNGMKSLQVLGLIHTELTSVSMDKVLSVLAVHSQPIIEQRNSFTSLGNIQPMSYSYAQNKQIYNSRQNAVAGDNHHRSRRQVVTSDNQTLEQWAEDMYEKFQLELQSDTTPVEAENARVIGFIYIVLLSFEAALFLVFDLWQQCDKWMKKLMIRLHKMGWYRKPSIRSVKGARDTTMSPGIQSERTELSIVSFSTKSLEMEISMKSNGNPPSDMSAVCI